MPVRVSVHKRSERAFVSLKDPAKTAFRPGIRSAFYQVGQIVRDETRRLLNTGPKTGRLYRREGGRLHQASAPGEPAATDIGELQGSVDFDVRNEHQMEVGDKAAHGVFMELGVKRRIAPRPHLTPAVNTTAAQALEAFSQHVRRRLFR